MEIGRYSLCVWILAFLFLFLQETCKAKHKLCPPSSCGKIHNISNPFRLEGHPTSCGDKRYTLACENNRTVLHLYSGKYYVEAINYDNYTIRLVDPNVHKDNCSSIPLYSLNSYNFSGSDTYSTYIVHRVTSYSIVPLSEVIVFLECENPVNSLHYIDTAPCNFVTGTYPSSSASALSQDKRHSYVMAYGGFRYPLDFYSQRLDVSDLDSSCRIEQVALKSWKGRNVTNTTSYMDIHNELLYGFEISWLTYFNKRGRRRRYCYVDDSNKVSCRIECVQSAQNTRARCSKISKILILMLILIHI